MYMRWTDKTSFVKWETYGYARVADREVMRFYPTTANEGVAFPAGISFPGTFLAGVHPIDFSDVVAPAAPGNYGNTFNSSWLAINGNGSFGSKMMYSNTATDNSVLYGEGLRIRSNYAGAKVVGLNVAASAAVDNAGQLIGGQFYMQTAGKTVASSLPCCALYAKTVGDAANANATSALWIDDGSTVKPTTMYMMDMTFNGNTVTADAVMHIYGGSKGADALFLFDTCEQGGSFLTVTADGGATRAVALKCKYRIGGGAYQDIYLSGYTD